MSLGKSKAGRPKKDKTVMPGLRVDEKLWQEVSQKYKGKINKMFNEWLKSIK